MLTLNSSEYPRLPFLLCSALALFLFSNFAYGQSTCQVDVDCGQDEVCLSGTCAKPGCYQTANNCKGAGQLCINAACVSDACKAGTKVCPSDQSCRPSDSRCIKSCSQVSCTAGEVCVDGICQPDLCRAVTCGTGQVCAKGVCKPDRCSKPNSCRFGRICNPLLQVCVDDPCAGVVCKGSQDVCVLGECQQPKTCNVDDDCSGQFLCVNKQCRVPQCQSQAGCGKGKYCIEGRCVLDKCQGVQCGKNQFCREGSCVTVCGGVFCKETERCAAGKCVADPCAGKNCATGEVCANGACVPNTCAKANSPCKDNRLCKIGSGGAFCLSDPCTTITCPAGMKCSNGECLGNLPCQVDSECPGEGVCLQGICQKPTCYKDKTLCKDGEICLGGSCVKNPCDGKTCPADQRCRPTTGRCVSICPPCKEGTYCDGTTFSKCVKDPCDGVTCNAGEVCKEGKCVVETCAVANQNFCKYARACLSSRCNDDPCLSMKCKDEEVCKAGICVRKEPFPEPAPEPTPDLPEYVVGGGCQCAQSDASTPLGFLLLMGLVLVGMIRRRNQS